MHLLRFGAAGVPDEGAVNAIRDAYHLRGWKHLVTTSQQGGPVKNGTTDVWMVMDGINVRGAVILAEGLQGVEPLLRGGGQEMGRRARKRAEGFSLAAMAEQLFALYRSLAPA